MRFSAFELDEERFELRENGSPVRLQRKPLALLLHLVRHRHRVVSREEILEALWSDTSVSDSAVSKTINKVREAVGDTGKEGSVIRTFHGLGFRFIAPVEPLTALPGEAPTPAPAEAPAARTGPPFVGRESEQRRLEEALDLARRGQGGAVLVAGEPGIGKTRLSLELAASARSAGMVVRRTECWDGGRSATFWLWTDLLQNLLDEEGPEAFEELAAAERAEIARLLPSLAAGAEMPGLAMPGMDSELARSRMFAAIARLLKLRSRRQPELLIFEDLHWADPASLLMLRFLLGALKGASLLVVGTYRSTELDRNEDLPGLVAEFLRRPGSAHIDLTGLNAAELTRYVEAVVGGSPPPRVIGALLERTAGNPFFVAQIVRLAEREAAGMDSTTGGFAADLDALTRSMPSEIREVVRHRLAQLSVECRRVLSLAAVVGREFSGAILARASTLPHDELLQALEEAMRAHLVERLRRPEPTYAFSHALVRETVYDSLGEVERVGHHVQVGEAIEALHAGQLDPHVASLALHFSEAALLRGEKAVHYARRAGDLAQEALAHAEAAEHYERALGLLSLASEPDLARRAELLVCRGNALQHARGPYREVFRQAIALARQAGAPKLFALAVVCYAEFHAVLWLPDEVALLEEAADWLGSEEGPLQMTVLCQLAVHLACHPRFEERAEQVIERAVAMATRLGRRFLGQALWGRAAVHRRTRPTQVQERLDDLSRALAIAEESGDTWLQIIARRMRMSAFLELGDVASRRAEFAALEPLLTAGGSYWSFIEQANRVTTCLLEGRFQEAEDALMAYHGDRASESDHPSLAINVPFVLSAIRWEQGRFPEVLPVMEATAKQFSQDLQILIEPGIAIALLDAGREEEARARFETVVASGFGEVIGTESWPFTLSLWSEMCVRLAHVEGARRLYELLRPFRRYCVIAGTTSWICFGPYALHLARLAAVLGDWDHAQELFDEALERSASLESRSWRARTLIARARAELARGGEGSASRARPLLREGLAIAESLGMEKLKESFVALLDGVGEGARGPIGAW